MSPTLTERGARTPPVPGGGDGTDATGRGGSSSPRHGGRRSWRLR